MKQVNGWVDISIRGFFASSVPGDWGTDGTPENGVPVLRSTNFRNNGSIDYSDVAYRQIEESRLSKRRVDRGTILIEKSGGSPSQAAGRVVYCDRDFNGTASNFIEVVRVKHDLSSRYVAFLLHHLYQTGLVLKYQQQTTGIINFKLDQYVEETVKYPASKNEQTKIAEVLLTVDRAVEQTEALLAKQQRIKTGLMQDLLTRGIDEHGNLRNEETHEFRNSPLGRIPLEWKDETLNNCVRADAPICYGILMPGTGNDNGVPVIKVKDIVGGKIRQSGLLLTDPKIDSQYKRSKLKAVDVLITIRGTTGRVALVPPELDQANITQDTARIRLREGLSKKFFYFLLQSAALQDQIELHTLGQAVKGINIAEVKRLFFGLPSPDEQEQIAERLTLLEESLSSYERELNKLRSTKIALMQDLLTGKKRVTPLLEADNEQATRSIS